jgi:hypothetical protein
MLSPDSAYHLFRPFIISFDLNFRAGLGARFLSKYSNGMPPEINNGS